MFSSKSAALSLFSILFLIAAAQAQMGGPIDGQLPAGAREAARDALVQNHPELGFFELGGQLSRIYGPAFSTGATAEESAENFLQQYSAILGANPADLVPGGPLFEGRVNQPLMWLRDENRFRFSMIYYSHQVNGVPVFRSDVRLLVRNDPGFPLVLVANAIRDLTGLNAPAAAPDPNAFAAAQAAVTAAHPEATAFTPSELVIWAGVDDMVVQPALALQFFATDGLPDADSAVKWLILADAVSGAILYEENQILHVNVTGTVQGNATQNVGADICHPEEPEPLPYARVSIQGGSIAYTALDGSFTITNPGSSPVTVISDMAGLYFTINDQGGATTSLSTVVTPPGPADFLHNAANTNEFVRASVNVYRHANIVRDMVLSANPAYPTIAGQTNFPCNVNINSSCNAFYNGSSINFYRQSGSCGNTGNSDVVHHEYGHHVVASGGSGQGAYGEGMSDCMGVIITDQPILGYGFNLNCSAGIRNANNNCQYQTTGCSSCGSAIHTCGQLISGCVWSTRTYLLNAGYANYRDIIRDLTVNSVPLHSGTSIAPNITIDFLTLDDDDANPNNGTPHRTEICAGFGDHSMTCPVLPSVSWQYPNGRPSFVNPNQTAAIAVNVVAQTQSPVPGTGQVSYRHGTAGPFTTIAMNQSTPNNYVALIPGADCNTVIQYYFSVQATVVGTATDPATAPAAFFSALSAVGVVSYDFQSNPGWAVSGNATDGQWGIGVPIPWTTCNRGNPNNDYDGSGQCWLTDNSSANACNSDVDGGTTTLTSQVINLAGTSDPYVQYARWFSNTQGSNPQTDTMVIEVSSNGGTNWVNLETVGPTTGSPNPEVNGGWFLKTYRIANFVPITSQFRIRFHANDPDPGAVVEAALDAFKIFDCPTITCLKADMNEDGNVDGEDVGLFSSVLLAGDGTPTQVCAGDVENIPDGAVTTDDIPNFVACLLNGGCP